MKFTNVNDTKNLSSENCCIIADKTGLVIAKVMRQQDYDLWDAYFCQHKIGEFSNKKNALAALQKFYSDFVEKYSE